MDLFIYLIKTKKCFGISRKGYFLTLKMDHFGAQWTKHEEDQLTKLFVKYKMDIDEISSIHKRSPEGIRMRLVKLELITDRNFIKTELMAMEKNNRGISGLLLLTKIMSKHLEEHAARIDSLVQQLAKLQ